MEIPIQKDVSDDGKKGEKEKGGYQAAEESPCPLTLDTSAQISPEALVEIDLQ
jgi:hypothetical protein